MKKLLTYGGYIGAFFIGFFLAVLGYGIIYDGKFHFGNLLILILVITIWYFIWEWIADKFNI